MVSVEGSTGWDPGPAPSSARAGLRSPACCHTEVLPNGGSDNVRPRLNRQNSSAKLQLSTSSIEGPDLRLFPERWSAVGSSLAAVAVRPLAGRRGTPRASA